MKYPKMSKRNYNRLHPEPMLLPAFCENFLCGPDGWHRSKIKVLEGRYQFTGPHNTIEVRADSAREARQKAARVIRSRVGLSYGRRSPQDKRFA